MDGIAPGAEVLQERYRYGNITIAPPAGWTGNVRPDGAPLSFDLFVRQQFIINNVCVAALTLYIWEFIASVPQEIALYRRRAWDSPHVLLFALVRYATVPAVVLPAYSIFHDFTLGSDDCLRHQQLSIVPVQFAVALVFSWRACAIWGWNRRVVWALAVLMALQTGGSFALLWFSVDELMANGSCMPVAYRTASGRAINTLPYFYLLAMLMDLATVGISLWRLLEISNDGRPPDTQIHFRDVGKPIRLLHKLKVQWRSLTPIVEQLVSSGLSYLAIATAFNLVNFILEITEVYYAKALIPLYAPLMAILGQRIVLLEARTVYADRSGSGSRGRSLVERVMRDGRHSWEGSDLNLSAAEKRPETGSSAGATASPGVAPAPAPPMHVSPSSLESGEQHNKELGLADFLSAQPTDEDARDPNNTGRLYRLRHFRGRGSVVSGESDAPSPAESPASPMRKPRRASASSVPPGAPPVLSAEARALALRMAGMEQTPSAPLRSLDPHAGGDAGITHAATPIVLPSPGAAAPDAPPAAPSA